MVTVEHAVLVRESDWLVQNPNEYPKQASSMFYIYQTCWTVTFMFRMAAGAEMTRFSSIRNKPPSENWILKCRAKYEIYQKRTTAQNRNGNPCQTTDFFSDVFRMRSLFGLLIEFFKLLTSHILILPRRALNFDESFSPWIWRGSIRLWKVRAGRGIRLGIHQQI